MPLRHEGLKWHFHYGASLWAGALTDRISVVVLLPRSTLNVSSRRAVS